MPLSSETSQESPFNAGDVLALQESLNHFAGVVFPCDINEPISSLDFGRNIRLLLTGLEISLDFHSKGGDERIGSADDDDFDNDTIANSVPERSAPREKLWGYITVAMDELDYLSVQVNTLNTLYSTTPPSINKDSRGHPCIASESRVITSALATMQLALSSPEDANNENYGRNDATASHETLTALQNIMDALGMIKRTHHSHFLFDKKRQAAIFDCKVKVVTSLRAASVTLKESEEMASSLSLLRQEGGKSEEKGHSVFVYYK